MMKGWQLFAHSVRQVFGNFGAAVRISFAPMIVQFTLMIALGGLLMAFQTDKPGGGFAAGFVIGFLSSLVPVFWIVVAWHRFVLLNEVPQGLVPAFRGDRIVAYFLRWLACIGIALVVGLILGLIIGVILSMLPGRQPSFWALAFFGLFVGLPVTAMMFRLSAGLPGAAIGAEDDFTVGWRATTGATGDILVMLVITTLISIALQVIAGLVILGFVAANLPIFSTVFGVAWDIASIWAHTVIGASILTTLYGHYVEKRPLV